MLGNSPITENYSTKVDHLKSSGVIQGFWSLNPKPLEGIFFEESPLNGFKTIFNHQTLSEQLKKLVEVNQVYFSGMMSKESLGKIITIANREKTEILKAEKFLELIKG